MKRIVLLTSVQLGICLASRAADSAGSWLRKVPAPLRDTANPMSHDPDVIAAGAKLFQRHCAACHGPDARGIGKAPPLISPVCRCLVRIPVLAPAERHSAPRHAFLVSSAG